MVAGDCLEYSGRKHTVSLVPGTHPRLKHVQVFQLGLKGPPMKMPHHKSLHLVLRCGTGWQMLGSASCPERQR